MILNIGSLNIDHVYRMPRIVAPGETLGSRGYQIFAGGKGANQSVALARAGASVAHAGRVGGDGRWLVEKLRAAGVETQHIGVADGEPTGHAIIQVDDHGQNAILLHPGANHRIARSRIDTALAACPRGTVALLQNEINDVDDAIDAAHALGLPVCFNPAPFESKVLAYPLEKVRTLIVNESEARGITSMENGNAEALADRMLTLYPACEIVLTIGAEGVIYRSASERYRVPAVRVDAADTTAAGDTFIGYFLAERIAGRDVPAALATAVKAAALCVSRPGAMDAIPTRAEVDAFPTHRT